jgi:hypothetical protein
MQLRIRRLNPALIVAVVALVAALGGTAVAFQLGRNSVHAGQLANFKLRFGKVVDRDTTPLDGVVAAAFGHANCKKGEQLMGGGVRQRAGSEQFVVGHISEIEDGPVPGNREYRAKWNSDLGGAARQDFVVYAMCLP